MSFRIPGLDAVTHNEDGVAAVEFALIAPVIVLLLFGIVQFGFIFTIQSSMSAAARDGARAMAIAGLPDGGSGTFTCDSSSIDGDTAKEVACLSLSTWTNRGFVFEIEVDRPSSESARLTIRIPLNEAAVVDVLGIMGERTLQTASTMPVITGGDGGGTDSGNGSDDGDDDENEDDEEEDHGKGRGRDGRGRNND